MSRNVANVWTLATFLLFITNLTLICSTGRQETSLPDRQILPPEVRVSRSQADLQPVPS